MEIRLSKQKESITCGMRVALFYKRVWYVAENDHAPSPEKRILREGVVVEAPDAFVRILWDDDSEATIYAWGDLVHWSAKIGGIHRGSSTTSITLLKRNDPHDA